jgi:DNA gyrase/topoisomerase IV subunit A
MYEVKEALKALIKDPEITSLGLMEHLPGPDFPTGRNQVILLRHH